jgi:fatty-acyl-CoA synthase
MWPSSALWGTLSASRAARPDDPPPMTLPDLEAQIRSGEGRVRYHIAPPLMHGTGLFAALSVMSRGGSIVCSARPSFDPEATVAELDELKCDGVVIVGDAFARPILDVLRRTLGRYDVSHMKMVVSSGMMWSPEVKLGLLEFMPDAVMSDGLGASESAGIAYSVVTRDAPPSEARFNLANAIVLRPDDLTPVEPGSGEIGIIAKSGDIPLGYYKDPERTARTYVSINGVRRILGGDHALVEADGSIRLLGRGSHCINTAGEKVYPEEVEEALKTHPQVTDALVFGIADDRFGQSVAAVTAIEGEVSEADLIAHVRGQLAPYKAPRTVVAVAAVPRAVNGKADYEEAKRVFAAARAS